MKKRRNGSRILLIAACCGVALSLPLWREVLRQRNEAKLAREATTAVAARKSSLLMEQANFENPARREEILRAHGYLRQGESRVEGDTK